MRRSVGVVWWITARISGRPLTIPSAELAERQARIIAVVADRLPFRPTCLPRALVLAAYLRYRRRDAELCVGVRTTGRFAAHAWVEVGGRPIPDDADSYRCLWRLPTGVS